MPRELEGYRDQLESIISAFPGKELLQIKEVAQYCGCTEKTAASRYPFVKKRPREVFITRTMLARYLVGGGN